LTSNEVLPQVIDLLRDTQHHLTGGMYQAREFNENPEEKVKEIFPAEAFQCFKKAMDLYPPLPKLQKPDIQYVIEYTPYPWTESNDTNM
jgi:hypothetical protein